MQAASLWTVLRRRWRDTRALKSPIATSLEIAADLWEFAKESTPERRRALFGDMEYDWEHDSNTTSGGVTHRTRLLAILSGAPYQPTEPGLFHEMLRALSIDFAQFILVDLGSGKGRTLLMAAGFPFKRVIGVELFPELHEVAVENIAKSEHRARLETLCLDARDYQFPSDPLVLYLFNPLSAAALEKVISNLRDSLQQHPRIVRVIYHNPLSESVLRDSSFLTLIGGTHQFSIYSN